MIEVIHKNYYIFIFHSYIFHIYMCGCLDMSYVLYEGRYHTDITAYPRTKVDY